MKTVQQMINVNGTTLYYERAGSGAPLVLVHGGGGDRRFWDAQFEALATTYDVVRYDLRGYGKSHDPIEGQPYRHEDDLKGLMEALDIEAAHMAGFSLGCQIVVDAYTVHPQLFRSIIAVGPYVSGYASPAADDLFGAYIACGEVFTNKGVDAAANAFANIAAFNPAQMQPQAKAAIIDIGRDYGWWWATHADPMEGVSPVATEGLANIGVPLLIVTAEHDTAVCREVADLLQQQVPGSQRLDIAAATHFMLMEKPTEVNHAVAAFMA